MTGPGQAGTGPKWAFGGKVAIVTGSARGIGKTIAAALGTAGARVAVCDIHRDASEATVRELQKAGASAEYFPVDLSKQGEPRRMVTAVAEKWGRLDILVNNARAGVRRGPLEDSEDNWDLTMAVGLKAAYFASQQAIPVMAANGGGSIVNIASVAALLVSLESPAYHAAKAGLMQVTKYLAANAGTQRVRVNSVVPGFIVQDEHRQRYMSDDNAGYRARAEACHPLRGVGCAGDVAEAALFLCSDSARFITGQAIVVDGGLTIQDAWTVMSAANTEGA